MMQSKKSPKSQLLKFIAVLPLLLVVSILFRSGSTIAQAKTARVEIRNQSTGVKPIYIIDGWRQPASFDSKYLHPEDIVSMTVWKGEEAVKKFGEAAASKGTIEIVTKLPLYVVDGVVQMKTSDINDLVANDDIGSVNILKEEKSKMKYGRRSENGIVEITTKKKK